MNNKLRYQYNCVNPRNEDELYYIIDNSIEITYNTFVSKIDKKDFKMLKNELGYSRISLSFKSDWSIQYYKSKTEEGKIVYYFMHSRIEYIFY